MQISCNFNRMIVDDAKTRRFTVYVGVLGSRAGLVQYKWNGIRKAQISNSNSLWTILFSYQISSLRKPFSVSRSYHKEPDLSFQWHPGFVANLSGIDQWSQTKVPILLWHSGNWQKVHQRSSEVGHTRSACFQTKPKIRSFSPGNWLLWTIGLFVRNMDSKFSNLPHGVKSLDQTTIAWFCLFDLNAVFFLRTQQNKSWAR